MLERVKKLERRNRVLLGLVILSFAPWILGAVAAPEIAELLKGQFVATQQLVIVEDVNAEKPVKRVMLSEDALALLDKQGKPRLHLYLAKNGMPFISFSDESGRTTMLGIDEAGKVKTHIVEPKE